MNMMEEVTSQSVGITRQNSSVIIAKVEREAFPLSHSVPALATVSVEQTRKEPMLKRNLSPKQKESHSPPIPLSESVPIHRSGAAEEKTARAFPRESQETKVLKKDTQFRWALSVSHSMAQDFPSSSTNGAMRRNSDLAQRESNETMIPAATTLFPSPPASNARTRTSPQMQQATEATETGTTEAEESGSDNFSHVSLATATSSTRGSETATDGCTLPSSSSCIKRYFHIFYF